MMQIQKGIVKYKERNDLECRYGISEDGTQYYFLENGQLSNGNYIASKTLVEVIDHSVVAASIGVIDLDGKEVIPFVNKSIKPIPNDLLLVEVAKPVTKSVIDAVALRNDPLAATRLVTTPATIKDKLNAKMGPNGKFLFNDQFSEASIFSISGENLVDNQMFSFIGMNKDTLFLSKNTIDSEILEYPLLEHGEEEVGSSIEQSLDVTNTSVDKEDIEKAMTQEEMNTHDLQDSPVEEKVASKDSQDSSVDEAVDSKDSQDSQSPVESTTDQLENNAPILPDLGLKQKGDQPKNLENKDLDVSDSQKDEVNLSKEKKLEDPFEINREESKLSFDIEKNKIDESEEDNSQGKSSDIFSNSSDEAPQRIEFSKNPVNYEDSMNLSNFDDSAIFGDSILKEDKLLTDDLESDDSYDFNLSAKRSKKDTIFEDVASTMSELITLNKAQKEKITDYEHRIEKLTVSGRKFVEQTKRQAREIEMLRVKISNYESTVTKLEAKNQLLDTKIHNQEETISKQHEELEILRPQIKGKESLVRLLQDAQNLLDPEL